MAELNKIDKEIQKEWENKICELIKHSQFYDKPPNLFTLEQFIKDKVQTIKEVINDNKDIEPLFKTLINGLSNEIETGI